MAAAALVRLATFGIVVSNAIRVPTPASIGPITSAITRMSALPPAKIVTPPPTGTTKLQIVPSGTRAPSGITAFPAPAATTLIVASEYAPGINAVPDNGRQAASCASEHSLMLNI